MAEVEKYLTKGEVIEREFRLKDQVVYATSKRIFVKKGRKITDYSYQHISSIGYNYKRYYKYVLVGLLLFFLGWMSGHFHGGVATLLYLAGLVTIATAIWAKSEWLEMHVVGLAEPIIFRGSREQLDSLLKIIRERRV